MRRTGTSVAATVLATMVVSTLSMVSSLPGAGGRAWAAPAPDQAAARRDEAKAAFGRGNTAYNLGKYADAIAEFERAYALSKLPEILFNLGQSYRKQWESEQRSELGRRALHYYEAVVREAPTSKVRPDAEQFIAELTPAVTTAEARERQGKIAAAKGAEALQLAQTMFTAGQLSDAAGVLDRLLREPDNGRELLAEGYLLRGRVAAGMGDPLAAEAHFKRALELRPSIEIPEPKGQETAALEAARKTAGGGLRLVQSPPGEAAANQMAKIDVKVEGDTEKMVSTLELGYRAAESGAYLTTRAAPPATLAVPGPTLSPGAHVDYYVRALDEHGGVLAESGSPTLPFRLQVAIPLELRREPQRWYQKWWFWTAVGAVAVGTAAVTYIETRPGPSNELVISGTPVGAP
ncbi:MAG TPA: tetratricopeptide repeat protein [Polyangia bacterium]|jgi:tetratricopeptide (TPR) repeat protein|nr:tetratricopeptide repeat protein [Polyangia bacterium]